MGTVMILKETTKNPITLMGERAGVCQGGDISNEAKNYLRGLDCITQNHGRVLEFVNVELIIDGYSAKTIREYYTHIGGSPTRLQESTRYIINHLPFEYTMPQSIRERDQAKELYNNLMRTIWETMSQLRELGVPNEDATMVLPIGMCTKMVDKRNLRNLVDMSRQRMCDKTYHEYRELFLDIVGELSKYSDEWKEVVNMLMKAKCQVGQCVEKRKCVNGPVSIK